MYVWKDTLIGKLNELFYLSKDTFNILLRYYLIYY
jgi:hypothetical protein